MTIKDVVALPVTEGRDMGGLLDKILGLGGVTVYAIVGALVFVEDALFIGFVIPGETAAIIGGVTASLGHTSLATMMIIVVLAAILGDSVGYEIGAHYGTRVLNLKPLARRRERIDSASELLARRGGPAVFLGRFVAFLRATMPFLAGTARMRYRTFLLYNAAGGIVWGVATVLLGYLAGASYQRIESTFGTAAAIIVAILALAALAVWWFRRRRRERVKRDDP